ncbi:MAG: TIGR02996 domain-containing protein [Gemmataceae bacterium]
MSDHDALLAAVIAAPDDDLPRLVFADYLDEAGDPARAEFIRVQIDLARRPVGDPARPGMTAREQSLLAEYGREWRIPGLRATVQRFRRGFVELVEIPAHVLIQAADRVFTANPVRHLRVATADEYTEPLARVAGLARVETLDLSGNTLAARGRLERFLTDAPLMALTRLIVRNNRLWPENVAQIARSPVAPRLRALDLSGNPLADAGAEALAAGPTLAGLAELTLLNQHQPFDESVHAAGAAALARSGTLTHLRTLALGGHYVGDAGLIDLASTQNARRLTHLDLSQNDLGAIGPVGYEELVRSPHLNRLRWVNLSGARNRVDRLAAQALAGWPRLADGVRVDLRGCELDAAGRAVLMASSHAGQLLLDPPDAEGSL